MIVGLLFNRKTNKVKFRSKPGFTLIELLVVISIIGLLSAISLVGLKSARVKANQVQVKSDIRSIGIAVESYGNEHADNFPIRTERLKDSIDCKDSSNYSKVVCIIKNGSYLTEIPKNKNFALDDNKRYYSYQSVDGEHYIITGYLASDPTNMIQAGRLAGSGDYSMGTKAISSAQITDVVSPTWLPNSTVAAVFGGGNRANVSWPAAMDAVGIDYYSVSYNNGGGWSESVDVVNTNLANFAFSGDNFSLKVIAYDKAGNSSNELIGNFSGFGTTACAIYNVSWPVNLPISGYDNSIKVRLPMTDGLPAGSSLVLDYRKSGSTNWVNENIQYFSDDNEANKYVFVPGSLAGIAYEIKIKAVSNNGCVSYFNGDPISPVIVTGEGGEKDMVGPSFVNGAVAVAPISSTSIRLLFEEAMDDKSGVAAYNVEILNFMGSSNYVVYDTNPTLAISPMPGIYFITVYGIDNVGNIGLAAATGMIAK